MDKLHLDAETVPPTRRQVYAPWLTLVSKMQAMGLLGSTQTYDLTPKAVRRALDALERRGILRVQRPMLEQLLELPISQEPSVATVAALHDAIDILENSPTPDAEWRSMREILGDQVLAELIGVSPSSVKRYANEERTASDDIADRLHFVAMVIADLTGSYNELGIRRWFERPRAQLSGKSPRQALGERWQSATPAAVRVRELARSLVAGGGT